MKEGLLYFTDTHWTLIGLMIFVSSFVVLLFLHQKQYKGDVLKKVENLPFEGEGT